MVADQHVLTRSYGQFTVWCGTRLRINPELTELTVVSNTPGKGPGSELVSATPSLQRLPEPLWLANTGSVPAAPEELK